MTISTQLLDRYQCALAVVEKEEGEGAAPLESASAIRLHAIRKGEYSDAD